MCRVTQAFYVNQPTNIPDSTVSTVVSSAMDGVKYSESAVNEFKQTSNDVSKVKLKHNTCKHVYMDLGGKFYKALKKKVRPLTCHI